MDVLDVGRMAILGDPTGAVFAVWQPRAHAGAGLVNEPGAFCWSELETRDVDTAKKFYSAVFGWDAHTNTFGDGEYVEWQRGGRSLGGAMEMGANFPASVPPHWLIYFAVEDCDAAVVRATELGGSAVVPATDIPPGRFAVLADPHGAVFAVIRMSAVAS
jgi:predicted enzyme related to lactoylglutathione lyase